MNLRTLHATMKRNFIIQMRAYPKDFFIGNLLTAVYTAFSAYFMYYLLFKGNLKASFVSFAGTDDYMSYVIVGNSMYLFMVRTCHNVSRSLITELRTGTLESLMLAPFHRVQYFVGNMLQQTVTTSGEILIMVLVCLPFGLRFSAVHIPAAILALLASFLSYFSVSLLLAVVMLYFRDTYISQNTLFAILFLICGVTFPVQYLPEGVQWISRGIPVTASLELVRNSTLLGLGIAEQAGSFIEIFLVSGIYCMIGFILIKRVEIIALEKIQS